MKNDEINEQDFCKLMFLIDEMLKLNFPDGVSFHSLGGALTAWLYRAARSEGITGEQLAEVMRRYANQFEQGKFFDS